MVLLKDIIGNTIVMMHHNDYEKLKELVTDAVRCNICNNLFHFDEVIEQPVNEFGGNEWTCRSCI